MDLGGRGDAIDQQDQSVESGLVSKGFMWRGGRVTFQLPFWFREKPSSFFHLIAQFLKLVPDLQYIPS